MEYSEYLQERIAWAHEVLTTQEPKAAEQDRTRLARATERYNAALKSGRPSAQTIAREAQAVEVTLRLAMEDIKLAYIYLLGHSHSEEETSAFRDQWWDGHDRLRAPLLLDARGADESRVDRSGIMGRPHVVLNYEWMRPKYGPNVTEDHWAWMGPIGIAWAWSEGKRVRDFGQQVASIRGDSIIRYYLEETGFGANNVLPSPDDALGDKSPRRCTLYRGRR